VLDISPEKLLVVMAIALAVVGPEGIPRLARGLAKARAEIRRLTADVSPDAMQALTNPRGALLDAVSGPRQAISEAVSLPRLALADAIADFTLSRTAPGAESAPPAGPAHPAPITAVAVAALPDDPDIN
jgi:Sec-independent protein translocase protein TatA